jgi:large-conductance mechanosensitive channel
MNKLMANPATAPAAPPPTHEEIPLAEIRDLLARKA